MISVKFADNHIIRSIATHYKIELNLFVYKKKAKRDLH